MDNIIKSSFKRLKSYLSQRKTSNHKNTFLKEMNIYYRINQFIQFNVSCNSQFFHYFCFTENISDNFTQISRKLWKLLICLSGICNRLPRDAEWVERRDAGVYMNEVAMGTSGVQVLFLGCRHMCQGWASSAESYTAVIAVNILLRAWLFRSRWDSMRRRGLTDNVTK